MADVRAYGLQNTWYCFIFRSSTSDSLLPPVCKHIQGITCYKAFRNVYSRVKVFKSKRFHHASQCVVPDRTHSYRHTALLEILNRMVGKKYYHAPFDITHYFSSDVAFTIIVVRSTGQSGVETKCGVPTVLRTMFIMVSLKLCEVFLSLLSRGL